MLIKKINTNLQTGTAYTLVYSDEFVSMNNASANTVTIPLDSSVNWAIGKGLIISQAGAGATTITGASGVSVNGISGGSTSMNGVNQALSILKVGPNSYKIFNVLN